MAKNDKIVIVGLGYVGLPLALAFADKFDVIGFDINPKRITSLNKSIDDNGDIEFILNDNLFFTNDKRDIRHANIYIITVPTPVNPDNYPDLSILEEATIMVGGVLEKGDIVIYESTVYPGVTEDICVPLLERESRLLYNSEFYCGYSPERISPGLKGGRLQEIIKITSGSTDEIANRIDQLYNEIIDAGTCKVSSIKVAEAAKVVENTQRDINIALMNELAMMFDNMGIKTLDVLDAASTKWNFLDFKPGLVGGHCIGVDPYYLLYKSEESGYRPNLLYSSRKINNDVPLFIVKKTINLMKKFNKIIDNSRILVLGYTFKEDCCDTRNTKVKDVVEGLISYSCNVNIFDPYLGHEYGNNFISDPFLQDVKYDAILVTVAHKHFLDYSISDFKRLSKGKLVFLDIKGIYRESTWKL